MTKTIRVLIIVNVIMFVLIHLFPQFGWLFLFGLIPKYVFEKFMLWQLVTYMFLHVGLWHLVVNMLMLWFFGSTLELSWGIKQFLIYYFFTGIGAALCSFIISFNSSIPLVGASGAIFGILVAYAMRFPESIILLFFVFPMKAKQAILVLAGINLLGAISSPGSGVAYFAHLGGALFGYSYLKSERIRRQFSYLSPSNIRLWWFKKKACWRESAKIELDRQVDRILDKISKYGMDSLTKQERRILKRKSEGNGLF